MVIASMLTLSATVSASEVTYKNLVTDDTTIEEDFKLLGMDINEYYIPKTYNYEKWYVVAMSEAYNADKTIQTYFYLYNPTYYDKTPEITLTYTFNDVQKTFVTDAFLKVDSTRSLYKIKGFIYDYCVKADINITNIHHYYEEALLEDGDWYIESYNSESNFKATNQHSLANQDVTMELNYNSTLIIEEKDSVEVEIPSEATLSSMWTDFWSMEKKSLFIVFYNFNFPDRVNPDEIVRAKFQYDYISTEERAVVYLPTDEVNDLTIDSINRERIEKEYVPGTHDFQTNKNSTTLSFQTFVLGNRVTKGEFGYVDMKPYESRFNYDCSVLLESYVNTYTDGIAIDGYTSRKYKNTKMENIDFIELDYKQDGILYKCQVVTSVVGKPDPISPDPENPIDEMSLFEKFIKWFKDNFPKSLIIIVVIAVAIIALCAFAPHIVIGVFKGLFSIVFYIVSLPFRLIGAIFNRGKD